MSQAEPRADSQPAGQGRARWAPRLRRAWLAAMVLAWPAVVYWGLKHLAVRELALVLGVLLLPRLLLGGLGAGLGVALGAGLCLLALVGDAPLPLKLYPVAVNAAMLVLFGASLWRGMPVVERIARVSEPQLPPAGVLYTRRVTQAWCAFFVANGSLALLTALATSDELWALYNGLVAYLLMGAMFGGEWLLRRRAQRRWGAHG